MFGLRILFIFFKKKDSGLKYIRPASIKASSNTNKIKNTGSNNYETSSKIGSITLKFLQYHYYTGEDNNEKSNGDLTVPSTISASSYRENFH